MPIYEYLCAACGYQFEEMQKVSDVPIVICPECGKDSVSKLVSATQFQLKGTGWYETDFKNPKKTAKKERQAAKETSKSDAPKKENKTTTTKKE